MAPVRLLVIAGQNADYRALFAKDGDSVVVEQCPWRDLEVVSYPDSGLVVHIRPLPVQLLPGSGASAQDELAAWLGDGDSSGDAPGNKKGGLQKLLKRKQSKKDRKRESGEAATADAEVGTPASGVSDLKDYHPFPAVHSAQQLQSRSFQPDLVLIRSFALGTPDHDWRRKLFGLVHSGVPLLNSAESFVWSVEKALAWGKLRQCQKIDSTFPLVPQTYYSSPSVATFPPDFPAVIKIGSASQGIGKARVASADAWTDTLSLLQMNTREYFVSESFVPWRQDIRLQKIGGHYRAIRRTKVREGDGAADGGGVPSSWKANDAFGIREDDVKMKSRWKRWLDLVCVLLPRYRSRP
jgi:Synapsin, ATP binding domain/Synapsin, N-terminal domain